MSAPNDRPPAGDSKYGPLLNVPSTAGNLFPMADVGTRLAPRSPDEVVGRNIRTFRERADLTQKELTARLETGGWKIDPTALTRIEKGERSLRVAQLSVLAEVLEVEMDEFFDDEEVRLATLRMDAHRNLRLARAYLTKGLEDLEQVWSEVHEESGDLILAESGLLGVGPDDYLSHVQDRVREWIQTDVKARAFMLPGSESVWPALQAIADLLTTELFIDFEEADVVGVDPVAVMT